MAAVRQAGSIGEKWGRVTAQRQPDYLTGVQNPRRDWNQATSAAAQTYKDAITKSVANNSFAKGVAKVSGPAQIAATVAKGPQRFSEGVQVAAPKFQTAVAPFLQTIESTQLPPRYPKGDPRNLARVEVIAKALNARKNSGS